MGGDYLMNASPMPVAGHRHRDLVGERAATVQRRITTVYRLQMPPADASGDIASVFVAPRHRWCHAFSPLIATDWLSGQQTDETLFGFKYSLLSGRDALT